MSWHLNNMENNFESVGFVTPGGRAEQVLKMDNISGENLSEKDYLVLMCGTNDVARNEADELMTRMDTFIKTVKNKKVVLIDLPSRYDLADWSCVNLETRKTNLALKNLAGQYNNVTFVEASKATREMHTRQGLHLNNRGKSWLAARIKEVINGECKSHEKSVEVKQPPPPSTDFSGNELPAQQNFQLHPPVELFPPL